MQLEEKREPGSRVLQKQIFAKKSIDKLVLDSEHPDTRLRKTLGPLALASLGIGAIIGSGIFTVIGTAIAGQTLPTSSIFNSPAINFLVHHSALAGRPGAGPALALSMLLVAIVCAFTGLCYAEMASMIPIAGSAYTYAYATLGELVAWIIGWDLILEYAVSNMSESVGFAAHMVGLMDWVGIHPPLRWISPAYLPGGLTDLEGHVLYAPGWHFGFNFPAFIIVMLLTMVLVRGIRESSRTNNIMVLIKISAILVFIAVGSEFIHPANWHPFSPNGWPGVLAGGSIIFFTYIGFDAVSTAAEEARNPQRDIPIGIFVALAISTVLYISVAVVLTGLVPWHSLMDDAAPEVNVLRKMAHATGSSLLHWTHLAVLIGAILGIVSSILVFQIGQARVWFAMARDRLLPSSFSKVHPRFRTPAMSTVVAGLVVAIPGGLFDIGTFAELSNIGTLFAFVLVAAGVIVLRYKDPGRHRGFRCPGGPVIPILSIACCLLLMTGLPLLTWIRFFAWLAIGLVVYFFYSRRRSEFASRPKESRLGPPERP